ncbi:MAG: CHASE2 domain-containing protein [Castellaniella sp.]
MGTSTPAQTGLALQTRLKRRMLREWLSTTLALMLLALTLVLAAQPSGLQRLENTLYDFLISRQNPGAAPDDIIIIGIDDDSLESVGYWPWRRSLHARLIERLAQADLVALDLLLSDRHPAWQEDDTVLARAMKTHGRVVLPVMLDTVRARAVRPLPELAQAAMALGHINIDPDADGVIRRFSPQLRTPEGEAYDHLSIVLMRARADVPRLPDTFAGPNGLRIPFIGAPGYFRSIPYARVLDGSVDASVFRGKTVLVGAWGSGLGDVFATPRSVDGEVMPGVEILANILQGGLDGSWIRNASTFWAVLGNLLPVLLACLGCRSLSPQRQLLLTTNLLIIVLGVCAALLYVWHLWWPPVASLLTLIISYPLWSWRSQQAAMRHIDTELRLLNAMESTDGMSVALPAWQQSLTQRVGQLHVALERFRRAQQQQDETLRFLSHDMRAPLNTLLALTENERHGGRQDNPELLDQIDHHAARTLRLVDDFVDLSRASAQTLQARPVHLGDLLLACRDDSWARAQQKDIRLETEGLEQDAWVMADAGLLERALLNLVDNAIKYSAPGTRIRLVLEAQGRHEWKACIIDQGRGMQADDLAHIFAPFTRVDTDAPANPGGAGLGLAFVHTVAQRHQAGLEVDSRPGRGSRFCLRLPRYQPED